MVIKQERFFLEALETNDIKEIRKAFCLYIDKDATDSNDEMKDAIELVRQKGINIWEPHKVIEDVKPKSEWNEFYIGLLQGDLMYNFSKERLNLILEVSNHVYANEKYVKEAKLKKAKLNKDKSVMNVNGKAVSSPMSKSVENKTSRPFSKQNPTSKSHSTSTQSSAISKPTASCMKSNQPSLTNSQQMMEEKYRAKSQEMKKHHQINKELLFPIIIGVGIVGLATAAYWISSK